MLRDQVTPLELEVALGKREWGGFYSTDFDDILGLQGASDPSTTASSRANGGRDDASTVSAAAPRISDDDAVTSGSAIENVSLEARKKPPLDSNGGTDPNALGARSDEYDDGDKPFYSLVTGTFKQHPGVSKRTRALAGANGGSIDGDGTKGALVELGDRSLVAWSSPAADFLEQREYQGLEALVGQTEAKVATEGQTGIASDYGGV